MIVFCCILIPSVRSHLAVKSVPAGEQGVLAETRRRPRFSSPSGGCVDHFQLCVAQCPVDTNARGLPVLLPIVCAAQPYMEGNGIMVGSIIHSILLLSFKRMYTFPF